jgi:hypothetical protein
VDVGKLLNTPRPVCLFTDRKYSCQQPRYHRTTMVCQASAWLQVGEGMLDTSWAETCRKWPSDVQHVY